jgi:hypothetical protein
MGGGVSGPYVVSRLTAAKDDHSRCTLRECAAHNANTFPLHTESCRKQNFADGSDYCQDLGTKETEIAQILEEGKIPVISVRSTNGKGKGGTTIRKACIEVLEYDPSEALEDYVAISHVWADGLGNDNHNMLPSCQLLDLQSMVDRICRDGWDTGNTPFWLDTLCIPVKSPSARNKGIRLMRSVYQRARKVLVLDKDLKACVQLEGLEPLIRIVMSKWSTRLWTLQEAALANDLHFQFGNGKSLSVKDILGRHKKAESYVHISWLNNASILNPVIHDLRSSDVKNKAALVWKAVNNRRTSKSRDETICLATLLHIDPQPLFGLTESPDQRMCQFLSMLDSTGDENLGIPSGMIFLEGPRLERSGFGWAPKTWMSGLSQQYPYPMDQHRYPSFLMEKGLHVRYPGIKLSFRNTTENSAITMRVKHPSQQWFKLQYIRESGIDRKEPAPWSTGNNTQLAVILQRLRIDVVPESALLVAIVNTRGGVIWVHYLGRLWVTAVNEARDIGKALADYHGNSDAVTGELLREDQAWCIDGQPVTSLRSNIRSKRTDMIFKGNRSDSARFTSNLSQPELSFNDATSRRLSPQDSIPKISDEPFIPIPTRTLKRQKSAGGNMASAVTRPDRSHARSSKLPLKSQR